MYRNLLIVILLSGIPALFFSCTGMQRVQSSEIPRELNRIVKKIKSERKFVFKLKQVTIGKTGFYYILGTDGRIVYHPRTMLIGSNFNRYWFVRMILKHKKGCISYLFGKTEHFIYFQPLNDNEILCLSLLRNDLQGPVGKCHARDD